MRLIHLPFILLLFLTACTSPTPIPPTETPVSPTETSTPTFAPTSTILATISAQPTLISPPIDFSITIQKTESLNDGYILYGSYQWASASNINQVYLDDVIIKDAIGNIIQYEHANPAGVITPADKNFPFAFKITGKDYAFPLLISVKSITVILPDTATFQFDAGANPQVGDEWIPSIDVPINAYHIFVHKIKLISGRTPTEIGFNFTIWVGANINITSLDIADVNANIVYGGGGGGESASGEIEYGWALEGYSPAGVKTFQISNLNIKIYGAWQTTWQP